MIIVCSLKFGMIYESNARNSWALFSLASIDADANTALVRRFHPACLIGKFFCVVLDFSHSFKCSNTKNMPFCLVAISFVLFLKKFCFLVNGPNFSLFLSSHQLFFLNINPRMSPCWRLSTRKDLPPTRASAQIYISIIILDGGEEMVWVHLAQCTRFYGTGRRIL